MLPFFGRDTAPLAGEAPQAGQQHLRSTVHFRALLAEGLSSLDMNFSSQGILPAQETYGTERKGRSSAGDTPGTERAPVTLHLDGIVQVLNCHLSDTAIGMMTRIAVLKWLYHLYIKTPRKMFRHTDSLFPILLQTLSDESDEAACQMLTV
ncbi:hypothetical protein P7K49_036723 [Saguinus oedipus]|uniref:Uncharacterized protein n=1 Tax=Saguinus oedipus TaxID=9490 RepID=A0ABQ9TL06_SAGOE|nr:hypothetical protein P7K49_036723 [Saguinus oedipus]